MDFTLKIKEITNTKLQGYNQIKKQIKKYSLALYGGLLIVIASIISYNINHRPNSDFKAPIESLVDTFIPQGFVLVPLEIQNSRNLDSIIGKKAVVDLYGKEPAEKKTKRIGTALRIIRSPNKGGEVSVLVPESEVSHILQEGRLYWMAIHNPQKFGTKIDKSAPKDRIIFLDTTKGVL